MKDQPLVLFSRDIQLLTGMSVRHAQQIITDVWQRKGLRRRRWISILDFCTMSGMSEETVRMKLDSQ